MKFIDIYSKFADVLFSIIKWILAIMLTLMVIITTMEVVRRYIFGLSFLWAEELVKFLLVATTFIGGPAAYRAGGLAFLDLVVSHVNDKAKRVINVFINIVIIISCVWLAKIGFEYSFSPMVAKSFSTGLNLKMTYIYATIPIGFVMMIIFAIEQILNILANRKNTEGAL